MGVFWGDRPSLKERLTRAVKIAVSKVTPKSERAALARQYPDGRWFLSDDRNSLVVVDSKKILRVAYAVLDLLSEGMLRGKDHEKLVEALQRLLGDENMVFRARALIDATTSYTGRHTLALVDE